MLRIVLSARGIAAAGRWAGMQVLGRGLRGRHVQRVLAVCGRLCRLQQTLCPANAVNRQSALWLRWRSSEGAWARSDNMGCIIFEMCLMHPVRALQGQTARADSTRHTRRCKTLNNCLRLLLQSTTATSCVAWTLDSVCDRSGRPSDTLAKRERVQFRLILCQQARKGPSDPH